MGSGSALPSSSFRPAVSVALKRGTTLLLVRRARAPSKGWYAFPGGHVEAGESSVEAARRELLEETGLACEDLTLLRPFLIAAEAGGYAYRLEVFTASWIDGEPVAADDAASAAFYTLQEIEELHVLPSVLDVAREILG